MSLLCSPYPVIVVQPSSAAFDSTRFRTMCSSSPIFPQLPSLPAPLSTTVQPAPATPCLLQDNLYEPRPACSQRSQRSQCIPSRPYLKRHRVKSGVVHHHCSACGKVFVGNSSNAILHMRTHQVDDPCVWYMDEEKCKHRRTNKKKSKSRVVQHAAAEPAVPAVELQQRTQREGQQHQQPARSLSPPIKRSTPETAHSPHPPSPYSPPSLITTVPSEASPSLSSLSPSPPLPPHFAPSSFLDPHPLEGGESAALPDFARDELLSDGVYNPLTLPTAYGRLFLASPGLTSPLDGDKVGSTLPSWATLA